MTVRPAIPHHAVDRPQLRAQLDDGIEAPLTLLVAPAGSGKTVLLSQWVATLEDADVVWLELSSADDDGVRFAHRLVDALATVHAGFMTVDAALGYPGGGLGPALIEALAATCADISGRVVVVFDDLHRVSNPEVVADLWRLVDMLPSHIHFVFASRVDLRLGWSRHRLQHGLVELRAAQLAFDDADTAKLLQRIARTRIDPVTVSAVALRTEGWVAGVQLAALRLRINPHSADLIGLLSESDRLAIDYLSEEVLGALAPDRRRALLELSVLEEMSAGLVEAVAGVPNGAEFLENLERESLFIIPVDRASGRFRFHHLFRDLLRLRLRAADPAAEVRLLKTAAAWHQEQGSVGDAIDYLLVAQDWTAAIDLVLSHGREVYERGETATVARWLARVPSAQLAERPEAVVLRGMVEGMSGRAAIAETLLRSVIGHPQVPTGVQLVARAFVATGVQFRGSAERYLRDGVELLKAVEANPTVVPPVLLNITTVPLLTAMAQISIGRAHLFLADLAQCRRWLSKASATEGGSYPPYRVHLLGTLAICEALAGRLTEARALADDALDIARQMSLLSHPAPADAYLALALIAVQSGTPEAGALALHEGWVRASSNNRTQLMWVAHLISRLVDPAGTDSAAIAPVGTPPPLIRDILRSINQRVARSAGQPSHPNGGKTWTSTTFEDVAGLLARGDSIGARELVNALPLPAEPAPAQLVENLVLRGWLSDIEGDRVESRRHIARAVALAAPEGLTYPFIRAGSDVISLVRGLSRGEEGFRDKIISRYLAQNTQSQALGQPLTARESEILSYLPTRLATSDIAARCFVSLNTVKTHLAHIYRKLEVSTRNDAVARAEELGILQHTGIRTR